MWDLHSGVEIQSLDRHPNNVVAVKYSPETGLVFTASSAYVKVRKCFFCFCFSHGVGFLKYRFVPTLIVFQVWDLRQSPSRCIEALSSSGWPASGNQANTTSILAIYSYLRVCWNYFPSQRSSFIFLLFFVGETLINDIALSCQSSAVLYAAAGSQVRIWDIRKFSSTGKLSGGHQAAVMCLAVGNTPLGGMTDSTEKVEFVVTGSKDHYVKVFEVRKSIDKKIN